MNGRAGHATRRARSLLQASRSVSGSLRHGFKVCTCVVLAVTLALVPLDFKIVNVGDSKHSDKLGLEVQGSEAHAVVPLAGAAALAAELGISTEALLAGFTAIVAGTTGYVLAESGWADMASSTTSDALGRLLDPNADLGNMDDAANYGEVWDKWSPDGRSWDDLSTNEKAKYGTPAAWVSNQWDSTFLAAELLQTTTGGGFEPSPDPGGDKSGPWQKIRNALTILGVGAASIPLSEAAQALGALCGDGLHDLLFRDNRNTDNGSLNLTYANVRYIGGLPVQMAYIPISYSSTYANFQTTNWSLAMIGAPSQTASYNFAFVNGGGSGYSDSDSRNSTTVTMKQVSASDNYYTYVNRSFPVSYYYLFTTGKWDKNSNMSGTTGNKVVGIGGIYYINSAYQFGYVFKDSTNTEVARFDGTNWTGEVTEEQVEYGQITGTPNDVARNVLDQNGLVDALYGQEQPGTDGRRRAITIPSGMTTPGTGLQPDSSWDTFTNPVPEGEVAPLPDDAPVNPDDPVPTPPEPPTPDWDFPKELNDAIEALGTEGFGTLFPFCLVVDIKNLVEVVNSNINESGSETISIPLTDFEIPNTEDLDLDFAWLISLGALARPWWTVLIAGVLIAESVRYFLK